MKAQVSPALAAVCIAVVLAVIGFVMYRNLAGSRVDSVATMTPELRAKIGAAYGVGEPSRGAPRTR